MKKFLTLISLFLSIQAYTQSEVLDSVICLIRKDVQKDLEKENIHLEGFDCENVNKNFTVIHLTGGWSPEKQIVLFYTYGTSENLNRELRQRRFPHFRKMFYWQFVRENLQNKVLSVKYLEYKFICRLENASDDVVLYGKYEFVQSEDETRYIITNKSTELLEGDTILKKYKEEF